MGAEDIINYLEKHKDRNDITVQELVQEFKLTQSTVNKSIRKMRKYHEVEILSISDGKKKQKQYIRLIERIEE